MAERFRMRHNSLLLCLFSLVLCLSVWQLITGPGPPYVLEEPSIFAANIISDPNATSYEYPVHTLPAGDYHRLIDLPAFNFTIMNRACDRTPPLLLILIHSHPSNVERRQIIRDTWGRRMDNVVLLFVLGAVRARRQRALLAENATHGDFIQGNFVDSYINVTYKHAMVFKYAIYHCPSARYVLKTDDDVFVNLVTYMHLLHDDLTPAGARSLIFCFRRAAPLVNRSFRSKWRVSYGEYADTYFPDMCPGWTVLYSNDALFKLYAELQRSNYFWIDDVLITGTLREKLNLTLVDNADWCITAKELETFMVDRDPAKPFVYGPPDVREGEIHTLWKYTLAHTRDSRFHYAVAEEAAHRNGNATLNTINV